MSTTWMTVERRRCMNDSPDVMRIEALRSPSCVAVSEPTEESPMIKDGGSSGGGGGGISSSGGGGGGPIEPARG